MDLASDRAPVFFPVLDEFRLNGKYCDVQIWVGDSTFQCHRPILAASSKYFDNLFRGSLGDGKIETVILNADIDESAVEQILHFIYTGHLRKNLVNDVHVLLTTCDVLQVRSDSIEDQLMKPLEVNDGKEEYADWEAFDAIGDIFTLLQYAEDTQRTVFVEFLKQHILERAEYFFLCDNNFLKISYIYLDSLFERGYFPAHNEDLFLNAFIRWIHYSWEERKIHFKQVMDKVKGNVSPAFVKKMLYRYESLFDRSTHTQVLEKPPKFSSRWVNKKILTAYIGYKCQGIVLEFSRDESTSWSRIDESTRHIKSFADTIKHCVLEEKLYRLTFSSRNNQQSFQVFPTNTPAEGSKVHKLNLPPLVLENFQVCAWPTGQRIYVYDRDAVDGKHQQRYKQLNESGIFIFNCAINTWASIPSLNCVVGHACITSDENSLYLVGGTSSFPTSGLQALDHRTQKWRKLAELKNNSERSSFSACCMHQGKLYFGRGRCYGVPLEVYDPVADKWDTSQQQLTYNCHCGLISYDNKLWTIGPTHVESKRGFERYYNVLEWKWSSASFSFGIEARQYLISVDRSKFIVKDIIVS